MDTAENRNNKAVVGLIIVLLVLVIGFSLYQISAQFAAPAVSVSTVGSTQPGTAAGTGASSTSATSTAADVTYYCLEGTINAAFSANQVALTLSTSQTFDLPQVVSGSGIRYSKGNVTFSGEGSNATLQEGSKTTFSNCLSAMVTTSKGNNMFIDSGKTFSFVYPSSLDLMGGDVGYTQSWREEATSSGLVLAVVTTPSNYLPKTNFGDAKFTVGTSADLDAVSSCLTDPQDNMTKSSKVTINGVTYTKLTFSDAGAGNIYDTVSYRTVRDNQCYAIEYTIHSSNIGNYSPDQGITQFDQQKVQQTFDQIAQSFTFL